MYPSMHANVVMVSLTQMNINSLVNTSIPHYRSLFLVMLRSNHLVQTVRTTFPVVQTVPITFPLGISHLHLWRSGDGFSDSVCTAGKKMASLHRKPYRPLSRRLDRCDRVIQKESGNPNCGNMYSFSGATGTSRVRHNAHYVPYAQIRFDL